MIADLGRVLCFVLFSIMVGQAFWVLLLHLRAFIAARKNDLYPACMLSLRAILGTVALVGFGFEAVFRNYLRIGQPTSPWIAFNIVMFAFANAALWLTLRRTPLPDTQTRRLRD